ncbi:MAG: L,D-transpeptidase family protein [Erythrobacter sp.]
MRKNASVKPFLRNAITLVGAGLIGLCPQFVLAQTNSVEPSISVADVFGQTPAPSPVIAPAPYGGGDGINSVYVENGDAKLLFEGQAPPGSENAVNSFEQRLAAAHARYIGEWSSLPNVSIPAGADMVLGSSGSRVSLLRQRLGLPEGRTFDAATAERVRLFRQMHGLSDNSRVDRAMLAALRRGPAHYTRVLKRNLDHAGELPSYLGYRYVHVDLTNQRLQMIEDGRVVDEMAVVAGKPASPTPIMAGLLRHAVLKPYWNVPPDLVRATYARRIINGGSAYLRRTGFEALSGWDENARVLPASSVDWRAVERGESDVRLRQKPGPGNGMGKVKFMFPNALGIYLHDTASKHYFAKPERLFSAGCVRVERPQDFGAWLFNGQMPVSNGTPEEQVNLPFPVPIYITYFTALPDAASPRITYRDDIYSMDKAQLAQLMR